MVDNADEPEGDWPFGEVAVSLMWFANQLMLHIDDKARAMTRYRRAPTHMCTGRRR